MRPSETLEKALGHVLELEVDPDYEVDMNFYHEPGPSSCRACLAGSWMARGLGITPDLRVYPTDLPRESSRIALGLGGVGTSGDLSILLESHGVDRDGVEELPLVRVHDYKSTPELWWEDMREIVAILKERGL